MFIIVYTLMLGFQIITINDDLSAIKYLKVCLM